jgi:hypothetical protein
VIGQLTAASRTDDAVVRDGTFTTSQGAERPPCLPSR